MAQGADIRFPPSPSKVAEGQDEGCDTNPEDILGASFLSAVSESSQETQDTIIRRNTVVSFAEDVEQITLPDTRPEDYRDCRPEPISRGSTDFLGLRREIPYDACMERGRRPKCRSRSVSVERAEPIGSTEESQAEYLFRQRSGCRKDYQEMNYSNTLDRRSASLQSQTKLQPPQKYLVKDFRQESDNVRNSKVRIDTGHRIYSSESSDEEQYYDLSERKRKKKYRRLSTRTSDDLRLQNGESIENRPSMDEIRSRFMEQSRRNSSQVAEHRINSEVSKYRKRQDEFDREELITRDRYTNDVHDWNRYSSHIQYPHSRRPRSISQDRSVSRSPLRISRILRDSPSPPELPHRHSSVRDLRTVSSSNKNFSQPIESPSEFYNEELPEYLSQPVGKSLVDQNRIEMQKNVNISGILKKTKHDFPTSFQHLSMKQRSGRARSEFCPRELGYISSTATTTTNSQGRSLVHSMQRSKETERQMTTPRGKPTREDQSRKPAFLNASFKKSCSAAASIHNKTMSTLKSAITKGIAECIVKLIKKVGAFESLRNESDELNRKQKTLERTRRVLDKETKVIASGGEGRFMIEHNSNNEINMDEEVITDEDKLFQRKMNLSVHQFLETVFKSQDISSLSTESASIIRNPDSKDAGVQKLKSVDNTREFFNTANPTRAPNTQSQHGNDNAIRGLSSGRAMTKSNSSNRKPKQTSIPTKNHPVKILVKKETPGNSKTVTPAPISNQDDGLKEKGIPNLNDRVQVARKGLRTNRISNPENGHPNVFKENSMPQSTPSRLDEPQKSTTAETCKPKSPYAACLTAFTSSSQGLTDGSNKSAITYGIPMPKSPYVDSVVAVQRKRPSATATSEAPKEKTSLSAVTKPQYVETSSPPTPAQNSARPNSEQQIAVQQTNSQSNLLPVLNSDHVDTGTRSLSLIQGQDMSLTRSGIEQSEMQISTIPPALTSSGEPEFYRHNFTNKSWPRRSNRIKSLSSIQGEIKCSAQSEQLQGPENSLLPQDRQGWGVLVPDTEWAQAEEQEQQYNGHDNEEEWEEPRTARRSSRVRRCRSTISTSSPNQPESESDSEDGEWQPGGSRAHRAARQLARRNKVLTCVTPRPNPKQSKFE